MSSKGSMKRYLLGEASAEERVDLENRYLSDPSFFEELTEAENDLIHSYVRGELSNPDRKEFEKRYLTSTEGKIRVQFASVLTEVSRENAAESQKLPFWARLTLSFSHSSPKLQWGMAMAGVAMILAVGWLAIPHSRSLPATSPVAERSGNPPLAATGNPVPNSEAAGSGKAAGTELAKADRPDLDEFTVQLTPGTSRGLESETKTFLAPKTPWIQFRLVLRSDDHRGYFAVVETAEGNEVRRVVGLKSQLLDGNKVVNVRMPSKIVKPGDYLIRLGEMPVVNGHNEDIDVYSFRAVNK